MSIRLSAMMIAFCITGTVFSMEQEFLGTIKQEQEDSALIGGLPYRNGV